MIFFLWVRYFSLSPVNTNRDFTTAYLPDTGVIDPALIFSQSDTEVGPFS